MATIKLEEMTPAIVEDKQLAVAAVSALPRGMRGEISVEDVKVPSLRMIGKTSALADEFPAGSWVFDGSVALTDGKAPLNVVVVQFEKKYQEVRPYDNEAETPAIVVDTMDQVKALGGGLTKDAAKPFMPIATIHLLVEAPATLSPEDASRFGYEHGGKKYALAVYSAMSKTAYNAVGKEITSAAVNGPLRATLCGASWKLTSELIKTQKNSWFGPRIELAGTTTAEFQNWVESLGNLE
jgi:hypothetical protein